MYKEFRLHCNVCGATIYNPTKLIGKCVVCGNNKLIILKDNEENKKER